MELEQHHHIASTATPQPWEASTWNIDGIARRGTFRDTDFERFPVEMIQRDGRAERKVREAEGQRHDEVAPASFEVRMGRDLEFHQKVP